MFTTQILRALAVGLLMFSPPLDAASLRAKKQETNNEDVVVVAAAAEENNEHSGGRELSGVTCGCDSCTNDILNTDVTDMGGNTYSYGERITYVMGQGKSEKDACRQISREPYKNGKTSGPYCDPDTCQNVVAKRSTGAKDCGCGTCTSTVLDRYVTDSAGSYRCSDRIDWLIDNRSKNEAEACGIVASQFSDKDNGCGGCNPATCNDPPEKTYCGCAECTESVWNLDAFGHTCGGRIEWLKDDQDISEMAACAQVAGVEFMGICGDCHPSKCGLRSKGKDKFGTSGSLLWSEEFDGNKLDEKKWGYDEGNWGWGNNELQDYTRNNVEVNKGVLTITAKRSGNYFSSARINTIGKFSFLYGEVEASFRLPNLANGMWPAFWMLGSNFKQIGWPKCGEIDIFEMGIGDAVNDRVQNKRVGSHAHWSDNGSYANWGQSITRNKDINDNKFHTFKMSWTKQSIKTWVDGEQMWTFDISNPDKFGGREFHQPYSFIVNMAIGGSYTGITSANRITANFPSEMEVDYIRVYRNDDTLG